MIIKIKYQYPPSLSIFPYRESKNRFLNTGKCNFQYLEIYALLCLCPITDDRFDKKKQRMQAKFIALKKYNRILYSARKYFFLVFENILSLFQYFANSAFIL